MVVCIVFFILRKIKNELIDLKRREGMAVLPLAQQRVAHENLTNIPFAPRQQRRPWMESLLKCMVRK
jgi:plasmid replication initiation protein